MIPAVPRGKHTRIGNLSHQISAVEIVDRAVDRGRRAWLSTVVVVSFVVHYALVAPFMNRNVGDCCYPPI